MSGFSLPAVVGVSWTPTQSWAGGTPDLSVSDFKYYRPGPTLYLMSANLTISAVNGASGNRTFTVPAGLTISRSIGGSVYDTGSGNDSAMGTDAAVAGLLYFTGGTLNARAYTVSWIIEATGTPS